MRSIHDLDEEIRRAEQRLQRRRQELSWNLHASRERTRRSLASPAALLSALAAGFVVERLGRLRPAHTNGGDAAIRRSGMAGLMVGLGAAALRTALSNPQLWRSAHAFLLNRSRTGRRQDDAYDSSMHLEA